MGLIYIYLNFAGMGGEKMATGNAMKATTQQGVLMFAGQKAISVHTEGSLPSDQPHATVVTNGYRVELYPDETARLFHKRFLRGTADVVRFNSNGTIGEIELPDGTLKGYEILAVGKDGTYKAKKEGSGIWKEPKEVFGGTDGHKAVAVEITKAWKFYEGIAEHLPGLKSSPRVREELAKLPPPKPWETKVVGVPSDG